MSPSSLADRWLGRLSWGLDDAQYLTVTAPPTVDKRAARAELEAAARALSKGRRDWEPRHVTPADLTWLGVLIGSGETRKSAVDQVMAGRWVDTGGQVTEPDDGEDEAEPSTVVLEGDAAGWGGPVLQPHDADGIYHGGSGPRPGSAVKGAADPHDPNPVEAEHVYSQLLENYPAKALKWVRKASWIGPVEVPVDRVDTDSEASWAASHQAARVDHFADQLEAGQDVKPAVCVQEPGESRVKVIDGHHRYLGAVKAGKKTFLAYVGFVQKNGGSWDQTHVYQFHQGDHPQNKGGAPAAYKVDTDLKATERLRQYWAHGEGAAKIGWGTPGDFDRCVLHVGKFMDNPEGYCNLRHHDALGYYPATHAAMDRGKKVLKAKEAPPAAAGLAVRARDSGRVLMLQRGQDEKDPAAGTWEFPGGRLEPGESALDAARREWGEETGLEPPSAGPVGTWASSNGVYHGYVVEVPSEDSLDVFGDREEVENPDGDVVEALAWWDPEDLSGNSVVRDEVRADAVAIRGALGALKSLGVSNSAELEVFTKSLAADRVDTVGSDVDEDGDAVGTSEFSPAMWYMGLSKDEALAVLKFDPEEPRDPKGKWVHGLSELEHAVDSAAKKPAYHSAGGNVHAEHLSVKKDGTVVHKPSGTEIGKIERVPVPGTNLNSYQTTHANGKQVYNGLNKKEALAAIAVHHNAAYGEDHAPKLEAPKPPHHAAGPAIDAKSLSYKKDGSVVHSPSGKQVGTIVRVEDPANPKLRTYQTTHADGTQVYNGYKKDEALAALAKHHNYAVSAAAITPSGHATTVPKPVEKPAVAAVTPTVATPKTYEMLGKVDEADVKPVGSQLVHEPTGTVLGTYGEHNGKVVVTHPDGAIIHSGGGFTHKEQLAAYHNAKYGKTVSEPVAPKVPAKKVAAAPPKKPYETVGHATEANSQQVWGNGNEFDVKKNGVVIGHVSYEPGDYDEDGEESNGYWSVTHADGSHVGSEEKEHHAVEILLEHHNEKYGTAKPAAAAPTKKTTVAPPKPIETPATPTAHPDSANWADAGKLPFGGATVNEHWNVIDKKNGTVIGHVSHKPSDGGTANWEVTHGSGDKTTAKDLPTAINQTVALHNVQVDEKPAAAESVSADYKTVGMVEGKDLMASPDKANEYTLLAKNGTVVGKLTYNPASGYWTGYHADGHQTPPNEDKALVKDFVADYHSATYGKHVPVNAPAAEPAKTYQDVGKVKLTDVKYENGKFVHQPTGAVIGSKESDGFTTHANGLTVAGPADGALGAQQKLVQYHNKKVAEGVIKPSVAAPASTDDTPDWVKAGKVEGDAAVTLQPHLANQNVLHNGVKIGTVTQTGTGKYSGLHESGYGLGLHGEQDSAVAEMVNLHNEKIDQWHQGQGDQLVTDAGEVKEPYETLGAIATSNVVPIHVGSATTLQAYKDGDYVHVGHVEPNGAGDYVGTHADGMTTAPQSDADDAQDALIEYHNSKYGGSSVAAPIAKPKVTETSGASDWKAAGTVSPGELKYDMHTDEVTHLPTGMKLGTAAKDDAGVWQVTHPSGATTEADSMTEAKENLAGLHNDLLAGHSATPTVSEPAKPYETVGKLNASTVYQNNKGTTVEIHAFDGGGGTHVGNVVMGDNGTWTATHADGNTALSADNFAAARNGLLEYHNLKYGKGVSIPSPSTPAASAVPVAKPSFHKVGAAVVPSDVVVKKDGSVVHKQTGEVLGSITKPGDGTWKAEHADGTPFTYNSTRAVAVKKLLNYHNQTVAVQGAVQPGQKADWVDAGHLGQGYYNGPKLQPNGDVHAPNGKKIGHVEISPNGTFTVTHESGATFQSNGGQADAILGIGHAHNQAVHLANGTTPPKPASTTSYNAFAPKPPVGGEKQPYEKIGSVSSGGFNGTNVKKDPEGKIVSSDMTHGGTVVGHTTANPDGTTTVTHADGHVVGTAIVPGSGQASGKLAEYHNSKYGDATLPKPAPGMIVSAHTETLEPVTHEEKTALKQYTGSAYESINDKLRELKLPAETKPPNKVPGLMHDGIAKSRLIKDTTLYRGMGSTAHLFGEVGSKVGQDFTEHGFVSTSTNASTAFHGVRLVIHAPKGTHGMDVKSFSNFGHENEVILQHGTRFKINSDKMVDGVRTLDLTVTGP